MAHMEPEIVHGDGYDVTLDDGTSYVIPAIYVDVRHPRAARNKELLSYRPETSGVRARIEDVADIRGWFARLSAPGYLDATDWEYFDNRRDLNAWISEQETDDDDDDDDADDYRDDDDDDD